MLNVNPIFLVGIFQVQGEYTYYKQYLHITV